MVKDRAFMTDEITHTYMKKKKKKHTIKDVWLFIGVNDMIGMNSILLLCIDLD